jgi:S-adenosyl-L-methionine hydrolase (adenosine-forming)
MPATGRTIVFLSDFGYRNEWVGICHAVMNRIAPASPSVGRDRDVALEAADGRLIVGPDNGLLAPAASALGGVRRAVEITSAEVVLRPVSPSFHARDVLAPAAAHLAAGGSFTALGDTLAPATLVELVIPEATVEHGKIECEVLDLNRFGNVLLNVRESQLADAGLDRVEQIQVDATSGSGRARRVATYADVESGDWGLIVDPRGWLSVVRGNPANAAEGLGSVAPGDPIWLTAGGR